MSEQVHVMRGATWIALGFAGMYATGLVSALAGLPFAVVQAEASTMFGVGVAVSAVTLALQVGVVFYAIRQAASGAPRPPWVLLIVVVVLALFTYPVSVGSSFLVTAVAARVTDPEGLAQIAISNSVLSVVRGGLHAVLLVGVVIALGLRWQRAIDARE